MSRVRFPLHALVELAAMSRTAVVDGSDVRIAATQLVYLNSDGETPGTCAALDRRTEWQELLDRKGQCRGRGI